MSVLYDNRDIYKEIVLDLPFREGIGIITHSEAKTHPNVRLINTPTWTTLPSGLMTIGLTGASSEYLEADAADTANLDFTTGDYSIGVWIKWTAGVQSQIIIGRYEVNVTGWEIYLDVSGGLNTVSQRHSHVSLAPNTNSNCYSTGWTPATWFLLGISRIGGDLYPVHHRNGVPLTMSYEASGMLDADSCNQDLVIGARYSKDANFYTGLMWRPRVWPKALTAEDWVTLYELEKGWFA